MKGRRRRAACVVRDGMGIQGYENTVGCFMGDSGAAIQFRVSFMPPATVWNDALTTDMSTSMIAGCEFTGNNVDLSVRKYADDLTRTHARHDAQMAAYKAQRSDLIWNDKLSAIGLQQNADCTFIGTGYYRRLLVRRSTTNSLLPTVYCRRLLARALTDTRAPYMTVRPLSTAKSTPRLCS
eukprot:2695884-Pyramimonas_sp.AAC.1